MIDYLLAGITFAFAAAIQPGPLQAYIVSQALSKGFSKTLPAALAPVISDGPIIVLVLLLLINMPSLLLNVLQTAGGIFLIYLSYGTYKSWKEFESKEIVELSGKQTLLKAVTVNLLNPNPYLGWSLVMGPLLLKGWRESPLNGIVLLTSFYVTIVVGLIITIYITSTARKLGTNTNKLLLGISALALACFGIYSLISGLKPFFT